MHPTVTMTIMQWLRILTFQYDAQVLEQLRKGMTAAAGNGPMSSVVAATSK